MQTTLSSARGGDQSAVVSQLQQVIGLAAILLKCGATIHNWGDNGSKSQNLEDDL